MALEDDDSIPEWIDKRYGELAAGDGMLLEGSYELTPLHIDENEGNGVLVPEHDYEVDSNGYFNFSKEKVKCGVSSCNLYGTEMSQNCYSVNDVSNCRLFTPEKEIVEELEEVVEGGSEAGKTRKIYF